MTRRDVPGGFTLMEVVVALALGGLVVAGGHALLAALADGERQITAAAVRADRAANGEAVLRSLLGRVEVGTPGSGPFTGAEFAVRFTTWCEVPAGWLERCPVTIAIETRGGESVLIAMFPHSAPVVLLRGLRGGTFRYLNDAADGGRWLHTWGGGVTTPLALGVIVTRDTLRADTLIIRIGERG